MGFGEGFGTISACNRFVCIENSFDFQPIDPRIITDPNDVESPRSSFVMGNKLGLTQQASPVSPNAEDISLILGTMTRGRSFSTTTNPKPTDINPNVSNKEKSPGPNVDTSTVVMRRKKSMPNTPKEKDSSTAEEFFIEVIIQRHARRLLQEKKLEALGYMSAALDFHLVI